MSLSAFFKETALPIEEQEIVISNRFVGGDGRPIAWRIRGVPEARNAELRDECTKRTTDKKTKRVETRFDGNRYSALLAAESVVYPDLHDAELQKSYGVMGADKLVVAMLTAGEFTRLSEAVQQASGFDLEEAIKDAKNF